MNRLLFGMRTRPAAVVTRFCRDRGGMAAVEFAMIVPILLAIFIGAVELSQIVTADRRVSQMAASTADLVARADKNMTCVELRDILDASSWIMKPYKPNNVQITVRNIVNDGSSNLETWKVTYTGPAVSGTGSDPCPPVLCPAAGEAGAANPPPPAGLIASGGGLVVVDVAYSYQPTIFDHFMKKQSGGSGGIYSLSETSMHPPRANSATLELSDGSKCGG